MPSKAELIRAVKTLDLKLVRDLLDRKPALIDVTERDGRNLLHLACSVSCDDRGWPESLAARVVNLLLDRGLPVDTPVGKDACTPLFFAVARGRSSTLIKLLLRRGAHVDAAPGGGLFAAAWWDDVEDLKLLLDAGAKIDVEAEVTPFLASWCWKRFAAAKYLVLRGANVNYRDKKGRTALHHGVEKEFDPALLEWLVAHGASPDIEDRDHVSARLEATRKRDKRFLAAFQ